MKNMTVSKQVAGLIGWLALTFAAAGLGAIASVNAPTFYAQLSKPDWAPPAGVFGPVWSLLYALMALSAWLVWRAPGTQRRALTVFLVQLMANALWSWLFFAWHRGALAAIEVLILLGLIVVNVRAFWQTRRIAGLLLLPYLLWVGFAAALTWAVWQRNPGLL